jgi:uncharacterized protein
MSELRQHLAEAIDKRDILLVYLFGSRAAAEAEPSRVGPISDYDFGVLVERALTSNEQDTLQARFASTLARKLDTDRIDVVVLNDASIELAYAVIAGGRVLYERDLATRVEYEAYVLGRYGDYLPILREQRRQILEGGDYGKRVQRYREALGRTRRKISEITSPPD